MSQEHSSNQNNPSSTKSYRKTFWRFLSESPLAGSPVCGPKESGEGSGLSWASPLGQWEAVLDLGPVTLQLWCLSWAPLLFKSHLQVYETWCMVSYCFFENFTRKDGASWGRGGKTGSLLKGTEGRGAVSTIQAASPRISSKPSRESGIKPGLCHLEVPPHGHCCCLSPWPMLPSSMGLEAQGDLLT